MSMFSLQSSDSQSVGKQIMRRPRTFINRHTRGFQRKLEKTFSRNKRKDARGNSASPVSPTSPKGTQAKHERPNGNGASRNNPSQMINKQSKQENKQRMSSIGKRMGEKTGTIMDTKNRVTYKAAQMKDQVKDMPTQAKYAVHKGKRKLVGNVEDFTHAVNETRENKQQERLTRRKQRRATIAQMRVEMDKRKREKNNVEPKTSSHQKANRSNGEQNRTASHKKTHERPNVKKATPPKSTVASKQQKNQQQKRQNDSQHKRQNITAENLPPRRHKTSSRGNTPSRKRQPVKSKKPTKKNKATTSKGQKK